VELNVEHGVPAAAASFGGRLAHFSERRGQEEIMAEVEADRFTVAVFKDAAAAESGLEALRRGGFTAEMLSIVGKATPEITSLVERVLGGGESRLTLPVIGDAIVAGSLIDALGTGRELSRTGLAASLGRVGFQAHDGRIYETLTSRGGVLVAVRSEPRAADALAAMFSYGGGNAAIGAWTGRL
jgi:hypothetical protein